MIRSTLLASLAVLSLAACSPNVVNGTVAGIGITVADVVFFPQKDDKSGTTIGNIWLSDKPNLCQSLKANRQTKNQSRVELQLYAYNDQSQHLVPGPGDFTVVDPSGGGNFATGTFVKTESTCTNTLSQQVGNARSGTVHASALALTASGRATGTFDFTFGTEKVTGSFDAAYCDIPAAETYSPSCE